MRGYRILTPEQIEEARGLREKNRKYTIAVLSRIYGVGKVTLWENLYPERIRRRDRRIYFKNYQKKHICQPCKRCEICLTRELEKGLPPLNYQVGDTCVVCYLRQFNKEYMDLINSND